MKNQTIRLRKETLKKIFPNVLTKMRMEDFINKAIKNKKILNKREFNALTSISAKMQSRYYKDAFEFFAKRKGDGIELIPFD